MDAFETHYSLFHIGACTCGSDRWQNTFDWTHMATHIYPTVICRNIRTLLKDTAGANQQVQQTDLKNPKLPEQFSEKISSQFLTELWAANYK